MNVEKKKEMIIKLAEELQEELGEDEKLLLACSFNDYDKETITMSCDLVYLAKALCAVCYSKGMSYHNFMDFVSMIKLLYAYTISEKEGDEQ